MAQQLCQAATGQLVRPGHGSSVRGHILSRSPPSPRLGQRLVLPARRAPGDAEGSLESSPAVACSGQAHQAPECSLSASI